LATVADLLSPDRGMAVARSPRAFLAVSYARGSRPGPRGADGLDGQDGTGPGSETRVRAGAAMVTGQAPRAVGGGTQIWLSGPASQPPGAHGGFAALLSRMPEEDSLARDLGQRLVCARSHPVDLGSAAGVLRRLTPPFAIVACAGPHHPVVAATDTMGCRHLYWHQGDGWAGLSTSLLALACCAGAGPDWEALAVRSMLGFHLGTSSPFVEIRKLGPAGACALSNGRIEVARYADSRSEPTTSAPAPAELVRSAVTMLRSYGEQAADLGPVIELSGGLDSRIQVAAIPRARRAGLRAATLHQPGSKDAAIATQVAAAAGLEHNLIPLAAIGELTPAAAWALVRDAALRDDCSSNPVSHAALDWAEERLGTDPRVHGAGGEIARGFYYLGQHQHQQATPALAARLARWRLTTNEAVDADCLGPRLARWVQATTIRQVTELLTGYDCDWLRATDEFYTWERVVHWAGLRLSASSAQRIMLSSFLHPDFVGIARACPPGFKRGSRLMAMILSELDPDLARLPLDTGYLPTQLAAPALPARARSYSAAGGKLVRKVRQRLAGAGRPSVGAPAITRLVLEHWRSEPGLLAGVAATGLADGAWIARLLAGVCGADPATVGYLANLAVMAEAVAVTPAMAMTSRAF
jgi:asparagine synthase (glutamine-hydrolysing)